MNILIVPDKFKGTLSAREAADALARGWNRSRPQDKLDLLPMSDGGDGFGQVMGSLLHCNVRKTATRNAAHQPCVAQWGWHPGKRVAVIESARVIGLAMLPKGRFHPFDLDTFGMGAVLQAAIHAGARTCIVGIGGSATNDAGFGLARSLGWTFRAVNGRKILRWTELDHLGAIERGGHSPTRPVSPFPSRMRIEVAVDVQNPLLGARGATRVYGPQKGLRPADFAHAEKCLRRLARVAADQLGIDFAKCPGAGAAGGLGFGLQAFCGATIRNGFALFAEAARLEARLKAADLVISGEGAVDRSTLMGKGVGQVLAASRRHRRKCLLFAGRTTVRHVSGVEVHSLTQIASEAEAMRRSAHFLQTLAARAAADLDLP